MRDPGTGALPIINGESHAIRRYQPGNSDIRRLLGAVKSAHSDGLVFPATTLYKFGAANESTIFHDVTSGSNGGYSAATGWDYTTGFGSG